MRIVDRKTFLKFPAGTFYCKYKPCIFDNLSIKMDTTDGGNDWWYHDIGDAIKSYSSEHLFGILDDMQIDGISAEMDFYCIARDGLYDSDQLFAIWERSDLEAFYKRIGEILNQ